MKLKIGVLASGRGSNFTALLENSKKESSSFEVVLLISDKENAGALETARKENIPNFFVNPRDFKDKGLYEKKMVEIIKGFDCDLVCLAGYMRILSPEFLNSWGKDVINIHPSLLPAFPGLDAQKQALEYGVKFSGCTVHFVDEGMDTGSIIGQRVVPVLDTDDEESLSARILAEEHKLYSEVVNLYGQGKIKKDKR
jgi:phosphoribosylglycinamide formyltransferase-1